MGVEHRRRFWQEKDEYHCLAELFDENREYVHPDFVTSNGQGCRFVLRDGWSITSVKYEEYQGPVIHKL